MAVPDSLNFGALIAQAATDFFVPKSFIGVTQYSHDQLKKLWNPHLVGAEERPVRTHLGTINVTTGGKADGPALVLWPSLMLRGSVYSYQYEHFRATHRIVLIDSPGINKLDPLRKYIDLHDCAKAVIDILNALEIQKCVFGGHSWGAMLASVMPAYYPERLLGAMVINGTASLPSTPETIMMTLRTEMLMLNSTVPDWWVRIARSAFASDTAEASNPEFIAYCGVVSQEDPKSIAWALRSILLGRTDTRRLLRTIKDVPVLVIAGGGDRQFQLEECRSMADAIPTSKFIIAEKVGHLASRENPTMMNGIIEAWLGEIGAGGR